MHAETIHCQSCGAAVATEGPLCAHCGARLATISCPTCFGMMFRAMKFCPHCGSPAVEWQRGEADVSCPACAVPLLQGTVGRHRLFECEKCFGIWLDTATFEQICRHSEEQEAVLPGTHLGRPYETNLEEVRYRRCPVCHEFMNRMNFAQCSGVVVDVCRGHGTWFDQNELQRIVEFIRGGGLERARARKKAELAEEARRLEAAQRETSGSDPWGPRSHMRVREELLGLVVGSTSGLLGRWMK